MGLGCFAAMPAVTSYAPLRTPPRAFQRRALESVDVLVGEPAARPHVVVGLFEANAYAASVEVGVQQLRLHGALRGCDAVQLLGMETTGRHGDRQVTRGACVMYTESTASPAATVPAQLPGEGAECAATGSLLGPGPCDDPWVCDGSVCVSPYQ